MSQEFLKLERCPWCKTATPTLASLHIVRTGNRTITNNFAGEWGLFICSRCNNLILCKYIGQGWPHTVLPNSDADFDEKIPEKARKLLKQASDTINSPDASIMVCSSALDAMLQEKKLEGGTLNERIKKAAEDHLITTDMEKWAHQIRLEANDSRHQENRTGCSTKEEAERTLEFATILAEILFVIPARVTRGIENTKPEEENI